MVHRYRLMHHTRSQPSQLIQFCQSMNYHPTKEVGQYHGNKCAK